MYERFYDLRERPFSLTPDPAYLYPSRVHKEALGYLRYGIEGHAGFIVLTGEIGSGKTTLLQTVLSGLDEHTSVSRLVNTMLDSHELIEAMMLDFGLDPGIGRTKPYLFRELGRFLVEQRRVGRMAILVIDEAQNLSLPALEEVRMLSNLETEKSKLIQIILVGQPGLRDVLRLPELEQLRQRIVVSYHLEALDSMETDHYINHRLRRAAIGTAIEFPRDVTDLIHLHAGGIPRTINVIADALLLFGYGEEQKVITVELAREVLDELAETGVIGSPAIDESRPTQMLRAAASLSPAPSRVATAAETDIRIREERLALRERQLVEQQQILRREYRVLRSLHEDRDARPEVQSDVRKWGSRAAEATPTRTITVEAPSSPPAIKTPESNPGVWARVRRSIFGPLHAAVED
jgi:putative secretion ATPase (PEP-CTERM system associated)